jgi:hypothetical protein
VASNGLLERKASKAQLLSLPVYIISGMLLIGGGLFAYLNYLANRPVKEVELTPEAKAYARNLKLSDVTMKATDSYLRQQIIEIEGKIANAGDRQLDVVKIYCVFYDQYNQLVLRRPVEIVSARMGGLKPGETKSFRLPFDDLPQSWNQQMPQLVIAGINFR